MSDKIYPEIHHTNITELDLKLAGYYFPILVEVANERGKTITYGELLEEARHRHPEYFAVPEGEQREAIYTTGRRLGTIWRFTERQGYPIISTLVINAATGECGHGITDNVDPIAEREEVYDFDWESVADDFLAHLSYERETNRRRKIKSHKKRSRKEAAQTLGKYWQVTRDKWPKELAEHREDLLRGLQEGIDPAIVFSFWVLKQHSRRNMPDYVYLAEYRNSITGEPIDGFGQIKIGCTGDLEGRAVALSGGVKAPIEIILSHAWLVNTGNAFAVEQYLHGHFREHHVIGEWFDGLDGALRELIQEQVASDSLINEIMETVAK